MTRYVLVSHGSNGSLDALNVYGHPALHLGLAATFSSVREALDFDNTNGGVSMSVMTVEKYEQRKIEWLIAQA